jgi:hypothetical protein
MIVGISTVYRRSGLLYDKITRHCGRPDPNVLAILQPSVVYNPLLAEDPLLAAEIEEQRRSDPEAAAADWDSIWRADLADFVDRQAVDACVMRGRFELPPVSGLHYVGFVDTSGSGSDAMTLAIAHHGRQYNRAVLDLVREIRPPFSPEAATAEFAPLLHSYRCSQVTGDLYGGEWPREQFRKRGIAYRLSEHSKSELYVELLPHINSGRIELLDHQRLFQADPPRTPHWARHGPRHCRPPARRARRSDQRGGRCPDLDRHRQA